MAAKPNSHGSATPSPRIGPRLSTRRLAGPVSSRGRLRVNNFDAPTPTNSTRLTREQRKLMEQLRETLPVDNSPAEKGMFEKVKDYFMCFM